MQFGSLFTYMTSNGNQMPRMGYQNCKLLQQIGEYPEGTAVDQIWLDVLTGDLWMVPDLKCHWDITDNFPVKI
jgi:hypothetical protein